MANSLSDGSSLLHSKHRKRAMFSDDELTLAVPVSARLRALALKSDLLNFKFGDKSPSKFGYSSNDHDNACVASDSDIVMGLFLHYCNHTKPWARGELLSNNENILYF